MRRLAAALMAMTMVTLAVPMPASSSAIPVARGAVYEYFGWGAPEKPAGVMKATGVRDFTLAFVLADGGCTPSWTGTGTLTGGPETAAIRTIRGAGGDVDVSIGGWSGSKLGTACTTAATLAGAYEEVVSDLSLKAIDVDIESTEFTTAGSRGRVVEALKSVAKADPTLEISVTFGVGEAGPTATGVSMIDEAAGEGFQPFAWTVMPFDFGVPVSNMATASERAATATATVIAKAYKISQATAYRHLGISSMNGTTDDKGATVSLGNFETIESFATTHHLARLTFWALNRDRQCGVHLHLGTGDCSGIVQATYAFTKVVAGYRG